MRSATAAALSSYVVTKSAAHLLKSAPIRFIGNIEGNELYTGKADVIVCDGFVGNVILKTAEGAAVFVRDALREAYAGASPLGKVGGLLSRGAFAALREKTDYATYGGAPLLGVRGNCIVAHGRSDAKAIRNAIKQAAALARADLVGVIGAAVAR